jgi:GntR family transcriptional regulator
VILRVDPASPVPPYEQIRSQVVTMIATGVLPVGTRLPAIRQLSADLGLASGTVARAYREMELAGVISTHGRHGTFVELPQNGHGPARAAELTDAARSFAVRVRQLGVDAEEALRAARTALGEVSR